MVVSNTIQPINLFYAHNLVTETVAYIFVNTESLGLPYKNAVGRGKSALALFKDILEFEHVEVFTDLTKSNIIEKLEELQERADDFEQRKKRMNDRVEELFAELDPDGDGTLTKEQTWTFVQKMAEATKKMVTREEFDAEYEKLDFNAD